MQQGESKIDVNTQKFVFLSYAWGLGISVKEWLPEVISYFNCCGFSVFWDRDSISIGESIDDAVKNALSLRPICIFCICDEDYLKAASQDESGVFFELKMIAEIAKTEGVRIIPVLINDVPKKSLPPLLQGRVNLDLTSLQARALPLGQAFASVVVGATQQEIFALISSQIETAEVENKARNYLQKKSLGLYGNPKTHKVLINYDELLLPPQWMIESPLWVHHLNDDYQDFSPKRGIWHWDHWTPSTGMLAFGTAICAAFFPDKVSDKEISAIEHCGKILATKEIKMIKRTEPFILNWSEFLQCILTSDGGTKALHTLMA